MSTLNRLKFSPALRRAAPATAPSNWFRVPGAYVEDRRGKLTYFVVKAGAKAPEMVSKEDAERVAFTEMTDQEQVAHDVLSERQAPESEANPGRWATAEDCLRAHPGTLFDVGAERVWRQKPDGTFEQVPGYRLISRKDTDAVLHASTDAYEEVPQSIPLSLLDGAGVPYRYAWASSDVQRVRPVGEERGRNVVVDGRRVGILFDVPGVGARIPGMQAGGTLVTSHDGSTAIRATACLTLNGTTLFHTRTHSWKHSSKVEERLQDSKETLAYLARAASGLVRDAEACVKVDGAVAADAVLREVAPELYDAPKLGSEGTRTQEELDQWIAEQAEDRAACLARLHERAVQLGGAQPDPERPAEWLGGLRFVLAAPYARSNRTPSERSFYDGGARDRLSRALVAVARVAGVEEAGLVPAALPQARQNDALRMLGAGGAQS